MKNKGFSLLELLVVIGIISILLAVAISSYSTTQKRTRDSRRASDLKTVQQAAEQYYSVCGYVYPTFTTAANYAIFCPNAPTIMLLPTDKLPLDPKTQLPYGCNGTCDDSGFTLCATPELGSSICVTNQQ